MTMTYSIKKKKIVICKDGVYFSLTLSQLKEINLLSAKLLHNEDVLKELL